MGSNSKVDDMVKKVHTYLLENDEYVTAQRIAEYCHISVSSVYRIIKLLRLQMIGVLPTKNGYILSEFATKADDVGFIRRCYGRRASDFIAIQAALPHINSRWNKIEDKHNLKSLLAPLSSDISKSTGMKVLLKYKNSKGL